MKEKLKALLYQNQLIAFKKKDYIYLNKNKPNMRESSKILKKGKLNTARVIFSDDGLVILKKKYPPMPKNEIKKAVFNHCKFKFPDYENSFSVDYISYQEENETVVIIYLFKLAKLEEHLRSLNQFGITPSHGKTYLQVESENVFNLFQLYKKDFPDINENQFIVCFLSESFTSIGISTKGFLSNYLILEQKSSELSEYIEIFSKEFSHDQKIPLFMSASHEQKKSTLDALNKETKSRIFDLNNVLSKNLQNINSQDFDISLQTLINLEAA